MLITLNFVLVSHLPPRRFECDLRFSIDYPWKLFNRSRDEWRIRAPCVLIFPISPRLWRQKIEFEPDVCRARKAGLVYARCDLGNFLC